MEEYGVAPKIWLNFHISKALNGLNKCHINFVQAIKDTR